MVKLSTKTRRTAGTHGIDHIVAALAALAFVPLALSSTHAQPRQRVIPHGIGEPISNRLLPDDEIVVIQREFDTGVLDRDPTVSEAIADAVERANVVVVVETTDVRGILVEEGTWVRTRIVGSIRSVLYSQNQPASRGQRVEVEVTGGQLKIGKVLVKAGIVLRLAPNRRYLLFLKQSGASSAMVPTHTPLLIENRRLVTTWPAETAPPTPDPLVGLTLSEVSTQVRRLSR